MIKKKLFIFLHRKKNKYECILPALARIGFSQQIILHDDLISSARMYFSMFHLVWVGGRNKVFYEGAATGHSVFPEEIQW